MFIYLFFSIIQTNYLMKKIRPSKVNFYNMLYEGIANILDKKKDIFLDLGCGHAQLAMDFKPINYIGIDLNKLQIEKNITNYPEYSFYNKDINNLDLSKKADFVVCVECLGINLSYDNSKLNKFFNEVFKNINQNASICFNIEKGLYLENKEFFNKLSINFKKTKIVNYGFFFERKSFFMLKLCYLLEVIFTKLKLIKGKFFYIVLENYQS